MDFLFLGQSNRFPDPSIAPQFVALHTVSVRWVRPLALASPLQSSASQLFHVLPLLTVSSGKFVGERLRGEVLPQAGSDLLLVREDGSAQQDVRLILRTDDGALILMTYRGVRHASQEVTERIARGERISGSDYYLCSSRRHQRSTRG